MRLAGRLAGFLVMAMLALDCSAAHPRSADVTAVGTFVATWAHPAGPAYRAGVAGAGDTLTAQIAALERQGVTGFSARGLRPAGDHVEGELQLHFADGGVLDSPMIATVTSGRVVAAPGLLNRSLTSWQGLAIESYGVARPGELLSRQGTRIGSGDKAVRADLQAAVTLIARSLPAAVTGSLGRVLLTTADHRELVRVGPHDGGVVRTSLDDAIQAAAERALNGRPGALVVVDPRTGAIRAVASDPDPAHSDPSPAAVTHLPGSTFKIVTAAAAARASALNPDQSIDCPARLLLAGHTITNFEAEAGGRITVRQAFALSCNTAFARIGAALGFTRIATTARDLGIDDKSTAGAAPSVLSIPQSNAEVATMAIGASTVAVTPLAMAEVVTTVARGGTRIPLHWDQATPASTRELSSGDAQKLTSLMQAVVSSGTGRFAAIPGVTIAGKTGTAENLAPAGGVASTDAWFVAMAPAASARMVVVCYLPGAGVGGEAAAPVVRKFLESTRFAWR